MKERPIIMTAESVRAILAGRKTQTRRIIKHGKHFVTQCKNYQPHPGGGWWGTDAVLDRPGYDIGFTCPYGVPGDRLWVKESFAPRYFDNGAPGYKADWTTLASEYTDPPRWRSPIHMPRWASRITLEITSVRVERVQEISEADARAEGITTECSWSCQRAYAALWDNLNGKRGYPWASNPWAWVVEFKRL